MLETRDLILKSGSASDWEALFRNLWSQASVFQYMFTKPCLTEDAARRKTAAYAQMHGQVNTEFFVYEKTSGAAIGIAGIKELRPGVYTVTDIALGSDFSGRGYGKQILCVLIQLAFELLSASQLQYDCFRENEASRRLALSCGFRYSHSQEAELKKNGETVILDYYIKEAL